MQIKPGIILKSTDELNDSFFENATILITEYNDNGAIGFVTNKPFGRNLNDLEAFSHCAGFPLYEGGPVSNENIYFIHQLPDQISDGTFIGNGFFVGGNFEQAVTVINADIDLALKSIRIFIGYCGWDKGELEAEMEEGSWEMVDGAVFSD